MFTKIKDGLKSVANTAYNYMLPKPAREYATAGFKAVGRLVKDLVIDGIATAWLAVKSFFSGVPAGTKSVGSVIKASFWELPKAAYYKAQGDEESAQTALKQAKEDFNNAANRFSEAVTTSVGTAYDGMKPILGDAVSTIVYNGGEAVLDAGAVASIGLIEGGMALNNYVLTPVASQLNTHVVTPVYSKLAEVIGTLETLATQQASAAYNALPSLSSVTTCSASLLPGFSATQAAQGNKPFVADKLEEIEISMIPAIKAAAAAA